MPKLPCKLSDMVTGLQKILQHLIYHLESVLQLVQLSYYIATQLFCYTLSLYSGAGRESCREPVEALLSVAAFSL